MARLILQNMRRGRRRHGYIGGIEGFSRRSEDFLGMVGAPEVPDLSNLAGRPLDEVVPPIDAIVKALQDVRGAIPVP